jgi:hypothetical protein
MLGHGDGTFASAVNYSLPFGYAPEAIAIGGALGRVAQPFVLRNSNSREGMRVPYLLRRLQKVGAGSFHQAAGLLTFSLCTCHWLICTAPASPKA